MMLLSMLCFLLVYRVAAAGEGNVTQREKDPNKSLENYSLLCITPKNKSQTEWLKSHRNDPLFDFLSLFEENQNTYVMVSKQRVHSFLSELDHQGMEWKKISQHKYRAAAAQDNSTQSENPEEEDPNKSLENYWVLCITPKNKAQTEWLKSHRNDPSFDFLSLFVEKQNTYVMVTEQRVHSFIAELDYQSMEWKPITSNVYSVVQKERAQQTAALSLRATGQVDNVTFDHYLRYVEMVEYMQELSKRFPTTTAVQSIGHSSEGRPIPVFIISVSSTLRKKPLIIIEAGCYGREWISPAMALYTIHELVTNPENKYLFANVDWHIIPILNPDGYEYSHSDLRTWRKTRSKHICSVRIDPYQGADINRNFDFHWKERDSSSSPCAVTYAGPTPFSEPETRALRDVVMANRRRTKLFISLHSFGKHILHPWSYTDRPLDNLQDVEDLAHRANIAQWRSSGTRFEVGSFGGLFYAASGTSADWVRSVAGVEFSYAVKLPGGEDSGSFDPPGSEILLTVSNFFPAIRVFAEHLTRPNTENLWIRAKGIAATATAATTFTCCALVVILTRVLS